SNMITASLMVVTLLSSSEGLFDVAPGTAIHAEDFFHNRADLDASAIGMYEALSSEVHKFLLWGDARADMVTAGQDDPDAYISEFVLNTVSPSNPYTDYSGLYRTIARCNRQLEKVYDVAALDDKTLDRAAGAYYGEALL